MSNGSRENVKRDIFAQIATQREDYKAKSLVEPKPVKLPKGGVGIEEE